MPALWQGGLTLYGGIVAGTFAGLVTAKRLGLPRWLVADALTPSLALGTMFGRIGCYRNGLLLRPPTTLPRACTSARIVRLPRVRRHAGAARSSTTPSAGLILAVLWARRRTSDCRA